MIKLRVEHDYIPAVKEPGSVGLDLYTLGDITLKPGDVLIVKTGVFVEDIQRGYWLEVCEKSGVGAKGIAMRGRIVDTSYRGEIGVIANNTSSQEVRFAAGQPIAQLVVRQAHYPADVVTINGQSIQVLSDAPRDADGGLWRV